MRGAVVTDDKQALEVMVPGSNVGLGRSDVQPGGWVAIFALRGMLRAVGKERQRQIDPGQSPQDEPDLPKGYRQIWDAIRALLTIEDDEEQQHHASQRNGR